MPCGCLLMRGVSLIGICAMWLLLMRGVPLIGIGAMWLFVDERCAIDRHWCHVAVCK